MAGSGVRGGGRGGQRQAASGNRDAGVGWCPGGQLSPGQLSCGLWRPACPGRSAVVPELQVLGPDAGGDTRPGTLLILVRDDQWKGCFSGTSFPKWGSTAILYPKPDE